MGKCPAEMKLKEKFYYVEISVVFAIKFTFCVGLGDLGQEVTVAALACGQTNCSRQFYIGSETTPSFFCITLDC